MYTSGSESVVRAAHVVGIIAIKNSVRDSTVVADGPNSVRLHLASCSVGIMYQKQASETGYQVSLASPK